MSEQEWLQRLKAGDEVFIGGTGLGRSSTEKAEVLRVTQRYLIIIRHGGRAEYKYRKDSGYEVSSDKWHRTFLVQPTPDEREKMAISVLMGKARRAKDLIEIPKTRPELEAFMTALEPFLPK